MLLDHLAIGWEVLSSGELRHMYIWPVSGSSAFWSSFETDTLLLRGLAIY